MEDGLTQMAGFPVRIRHRKNMRSIRMRVAADGTVLVSAPPHATRGQISELVSSKSDWIERQLARNAASPMVQADLASDAEKHEWRAVVEPSVAVLLEKWEPIIGVHVKKLAFRNMKSRWGSCQPATGRICINTRLALYPPRCLEYVVVHELVHMLEPSHGERFHALMDAFLPGWRDARALLR